MSPTEITAVSLTHIGRRKNNEDNLCVRPELGLFAVADGMGGYEGGEVASQLTIGELSEFVARNRRDPSGTWPCKEDKKRSFVENLLAAGVMVAHQQIVSQRHDALTQMGSTVVAAIADAGRLYFAHVGDSRLYRLRAGALEQLTRDHSLWAELEANGLTDHRSREDFPYRNQITRALGTNAAKPDVGSVELQSGDTFLLCSDGMYDPVKTEVLAKLMALPMDQIAERLVMAAYDAGGSDNISVVVLRVG
ncbi:MAG: protein phosphatase 2C domain-containing protein [Myxococcaceae bacterium]